jgi:NAD+ synthase (glutamine-hydrolysing)
VPRIRVAACQLDVVVGDLDGNVERIVAALGQAEAQGADLAVFTELCVTGYPPEDLLLKPRFVSDNLEALDKLAARTGRCAAIVGFVDAGQDLHNAAAVCAQGSVQGVYHKRLLPNYAVFDEQRYFTPGVEPLVLYEVAGVRVGVCVCEDIWSPSGPHAAEAAGGAELLVNINASPYYRGRLAERERMLATRAADASCAVVYANQVGGQDELVFDGGSMVIDADGQIIASAPLFTEHVLVCDVDVRPVFRKRLLDPRGRATTYALPVVSVTAYDAAAEGRPRLPARRAEALPAEAEVYEALVLGTRDYVTKNGFTDVVLGLSGGIDSSLVTCIAADAMGASHVHAVALPSRYSSDGSVSDAEALAAALGVDLMTVPIEPAHAALLEMVDPVFARFDRTESGLAEENVQGRIRATVLLALSNKLGWLVLICGNKSELAVGYTTIYGVDMAGGFAVIKDVFKTQVYELARYRNSIGGGPGPIPAAVLTKPPSAELRPGQRDDQNLPPYEVLDPILEAYVESDLTAGELVEAGFDGPTVERIVRLVDVAEWKRRQAPPGVRVTTKAFGKDRRVPITNRYR